MIAYEVRPIILLGGSTGMIGDPSGKNSERNLLSKAVITGNINYISDQVKNIDEFFIVKNNDTWYDDITFVDFLRYIGKYFAVNSMLMKDSIQTRINTPNVGISFTEFSYMLLQAYDYYMLHNIYECSVQIGGNDQLGNIIEGISLIKRKSEHDVAGFTVPLLLNSDGSKFGKSETGAVWLDHKKTSVFDFYKFWFNISDQDIIKYIKLFSLASLEKIKELEPVTLSCPERREAQKYLAFEMTSLVHGIDIAKDVERVNIIVFNKSFDFTLLSEDDATIIKRVFSSIIKISTLDIITTLVNTNLFKSNVMARNAITANSVFLNNTKVKNIDYEIKDSDFKYDILILRNGKNFAVCKKTLDLN